MTNPHTNASAVEHAEKAVVFLNQRFGYQEALRIALTKLGASVDETEGMLAMARDRQLQDFEHSLNCHIP